MIDPEMAPRSESPSRASRDAESLRDRVKGDILSLRQRGVPLNTKSIQDSHPGVLFRAYRYFGSWEKAVGSCGLNYASIRLRKKWTRGGIVEWIQERRTQGEDLRPGFVKQEYAGVFNAAVREYGGWYPAIRAAGIIDFEEVKLRTWDRKSIVRAIRERESQGKREVIREDAGLVSAAVHHFGSWGAARKAAGFTRRHGGRKRLWTRERILEAISSRAETEHPVTRTFADLGGMSTAATDLFGSWMKAVKAAGFEYPSGMLRNNPAAGSEKRRQETKGP